jgi:hypothetical protein
VASECNLKLDSSIGGPVFSFLASTVANGVNSDLVGVLALGALALIIFTVVYIIEKQISATFARIFALIVVAVLGVGLGFASISDASRTAGFTLLGTIAGYLAGTKTQTAPSSRTRTTGQGAGVATLGVTPPQSPPEKEGPVDTFL